MTLLLGGVLSPQITAGLMGQVINEGSSVVVSDAQKTLLIELADTIIPTTGTPGAKAAGVEQFIMRLMRDCYLKKEQETFYSGLDTLEADCITSHGKGFAALDAEARNQMVRETIKTNRAFFNEMRQLTVTGYFTSEIGATQALEYLPIPGVFHGDVPMESGQKTWAL
jgi:hypothetical protein